MSELPRGWASASLNHICELITDGTHHSPPNGPLGEYRYVTAKNIRRHGLDLTNISYVDAVTHSEIYRRCPVRLGDVLYIKDGATTGLAIVNPLVDEFSMLSSVALLRPVREVLDANFLRYQLNSRHVYERMIEGMTGSAIRRLTLTTIGKQQVSLPAPAEQKRIVAKLDALCAKSARARTELARIETLVSRYKQAVLGKAFSGELTREWRSIVASNQQVLRRKDRQIKPAYLLALQRPFEPPYELPEFWEWYTLPSLGNLDRGKSQHRPRNDPQLFDGPFPFIQTGDVRAADQYVRQHLQTYSDLGLKQSKIWPAETLCITIAANIAETALLSYPACFPDSIVGYSADVDKMVPKYAEFFLRTAKERIAQFAPATAQKNINLEILSAVRLPVAPLDEQHEIVRRIETAFARIDRLAAEAKRALTLVGNLDEAILAKAFRGELVPQDERDEPASVLLERIRAERAAAPKPKRGRVKR